MFIFCVYPPEPVPSAVMGEELVRTAVEQGEEVTVLAPFPSRPDGVFRPGDRAGIISIARSPGKKTVRLRTVCIGRNRSIARRCLENFSFGLVSAIAIACSPKADATLVETWPIAAAWLTIAACRVRGIRTILYIKDLYPEALISAGMLRRDGRLARLIQWIDGRVCAMAHQVVVISQEMGAHVIRTRGVDSHKVTVISDWLNIEAFRPDGDRGGWRREAGIAETDFVALYAGTIGYASGAVILAEAAERLRNDRGIRIVCVGEGPLREELEARARRQNLENFTLLPFQSRERVAAMHSAADVCVLSVAPDVGVSSVPSKLITYLASARPVIATVSHDSEIARALVGEGAGWVTPPGDAAALANAIRQAATLSGEKRKAIGEAGRRIAEREYSLEAAMGKFRRLFEQTEEETTGQAAG